ncbi:hypothetical protein [Hydrogenophaga taeniospiralis]|uniref:hypothetical protein n=1 Tax=Hydrogenophaga taeniospiralis TaxID=65656 RepID=UPI001CFA0C00|nr:hypothetical protein [Hydrogenophaga taeniospiralis]UCU92220.1 hypothetical protein KI616_15260 [Hydrogenophaga taeniospiralis]
MRKLIDRLRQVKPSLVLVVADGPKRGDMADTEACEQVRAEISRIDWDCRLHLDYAESNMGCSERVVSGLNWAFSLVDRAIILEDDIDADRRFFWWAARMLAAYENRDDVAMLCGHNSLVWWPNVNPFTAGIPSLRSGISGWATWRRKWHAVQNTPIGGNIGDAVVDIAAHDFEPALGALLRFYLEQARKVTNLTWDDNWSLRMVMSGRIAIVSPVNLVHHLGLGPDATLNKDSDDMLFSLPRATARGASTPENLLAPPALCLLPYRANDRDFDRARVLIELLVRTRDPGMARRLARHDDLPLPSGLRLHLLPFRHVGETQQWIEHLADAGVDGSAIERWRRALGSAGHLHPAGVSA